MCLCLVERTGERVGRGVLVVNVASGVNIHVMDICSERQQKQECIYMYNIFKSSSI